MNFKPKSLNDCMRLLSLLQGQCTKMFCPIGQHCIHGQCIANVYSTEGFTVSYFLRVDIGDVMISSSSEAGGLISTMISIMKTNTAGCLLCQYNYDSNDTLAISKHLFLKASLATSTTCDENSLINVLTNINTIFKRRKFQDMLMSTISKTINISVAVVSSDQVPNVERLNFVTVVLRCQPIATLTGKFACPFVEVLESNKHLYEDKRIDLDKIAEVIVLANTTLYRVCLSDLKAAMSRAVGVDPDTMATVGLAVSLAVMMIQMSK